MKQLYDLEIIAGPCSITPENTKEIINEIAPIKTPDGKRAIYGTRVVGLKSRTTLSVDGKGMGIDYPVIKSCLKLPENKRKKLALPSVALAEKIVKQTGLLIASEIMLPHIQLPFFAAQKIFKNKMLVWNPAVEQLGWPILEMSEYAKGNGWRVGIKNGKFLGKEPLEVANHPDYKGETTLEKTWLGLTTYANQPEEHLILIHRGVDVAGKGDFRNALVHEVVKRVKLRKPHLRLYFDPSHSYGPKLRHKIVAGIMETMQMRIDGKFLYDGILIEAGTSPTDTEQHITPSELQYLVNQLSSFRKLRPPKSV